MVRRAAAGRAILRVTVQDDGIRVRTLDTGESRAEPLPPENDDEAASAPAPLGKHPAALDGPAMELDVTPPVRVSLTSAVPERSFRRRLSLE